MISKFSVPLGLNILAKPFLQNSGNSVNVKCGARMLHRVPPTIIAGLVQKCLVRCAFLQHRPQPLSSFLKAYSHNWSNNSTEEERRKVIPKLVYLHNPWKFFVTKMNLWRLRFFVDRDFTEAEFIRGSKQAAVVVTNIIRNQDTRRIHEFTTPVGYQQITRDMLLSRNDSRLKLVKFGTEHIRKAIPMKVATRNNYGRRYCFIDMLFVGLRNTKDYDSPQEVVEVNDLLRKLDTDLRTPLEVISVPHRIVFAEIFMRFRRDYTPKNKSNKPEDKDWSVSFYKILTFDVLNYDPKP